METQDVVTEKPPRQSAGGLFVLSFCNSTDIGRDVPATEPARVDAYSATLTKGANMKRLLLILFIAQTTSVYGDKVKPICKIISQPDSPIEVVSYEASRPEQNLRSVEHRLRFHNNSQQRVIAIEFGVWSFDAFDRYLGKRTGLYLKDVSS